MGRGTVAEGRQTMVPLMGRWEVAPDPRVTDRRAEDVRVTLDHYPYEQNATYDLVMLRDATNSPSISRGGIIKEGSIFEKVFDVKILGMAIFKVNFWLFGKRMDLKGWRRTHELREPRMDMGRDY
ncbi:hypothetical protein Taro_037698 [Colocasia esculenta]|uniref:Uncharacterized protein n=1 Tax=Colocasia esculenta TaxID=4460 RepID=A0A843W4U1_COLES|nr:hypothetical protein [Colocasia esculenta]